MGIGNYSEDDIKEASRAFTGWTLKNAEYMSMRAMKDSIWPYGRIAWHFEFRESDHDGAVKEFLGERGAFGGDEIVEIICKQEATARFICARLFQFFAADEIDEEGERVIEGMMASYFESDYEIRSALRTLFNSDYFKGEAARYARVKAPVETVVGAVRLAGSYRKPTLGVHQLAHQAFFMGQGLLQPPTVEGWHEGVEWIDSGSLVERVNFAAKELGDPRQPRRPRHSRAPRPRRRKPPSPGAHRGRLPRPDGPRPSGAGHAGSHSGVRVAVRRRGHDRRRIRERRRQRDAPDSVVAGVPAGLGRRIPAVSVLPPSFPRRRESRGRGNAGNADKPLLP